MNLMHPEYLHAQQPIFNNWNIVAQGWYIACASRDVPQETAKSIELCGQRIVLFRGVDKRVRALDAYCPHMGTDLGIGRVEGNTLRCFFHHWAFDQQGQCTDIPCQPHIPISAHTQSYATEEKYGFIWVYPEAIAPEPVAEFDELKGMDIIAMADPPLERHCHHHICMMNGIDAQHLQTVHKLNIRMQLDLQENTSGTVIDFTLSGEFPNTTLREKLMRRVLGNRYAYTMRYAHGCLGLLTLMKDVKRIPRLHMLYAYVPVNDVKTGIQKTRIQPIYVTRKRTGLLGAVISQCLLHLTRLCYYFLRGEDGMIYDNIQFAPRSLLKIDAPVIQYMAYVNRLVPSRWSNQTLSP